MVKNEKCELGWSMHVDVVYIWGNQFQFGTVVWNREVEYDMYFLFFYEVWNCCTSFLFFFGPFQVPKFFFSLLCYWLRKKRTYYLFIPIFFCLKKVRESLTSIHWESIYTYIYSSKTIPHSPVPSHIRVHVLWASPNSTSSNLAFKNWKVCKDNYFYWNEVGLITYWDLIKINTDT